MAGPTDKCSMLLVYLSAPVVQYRGARYISCSCITVAYRRGQVEQHLSLLAFSESQYDRPLLQKAALEIFHIN